MFYEIETKYNTSSVKANGIKIWPLIRERYYLANNKKNHNYNEKKVTRDPFKLIKNFFYGIQYLSKIRNFNFIFFGQAEKRMNVFGKKDFDIFFDQIADNVGQDNSLFIELALQKHKSKKEVYSKNIISILPFELIVRIISFFIRIKICEENILIEIQKDYQIKVDYISVIKLQLARFYIYRYIFKIIKPKAVFVLCSYCKMSIVLAARVNRILVIEAQHGFIGNNHDFYKLKGKFSKLYFPDYLLAFGHYELKQKANNFIIEHNKIIPIGNLYLEYIKKHYKDSNLEGRKTKFVKIVCLTLQGFYEKEILEYLQFNARVLRNWLFIIRPKQIYMDYEQYTCSNIVLLPQYNIYQILKYCDFNISINSTTVLEADYLGVFNVLLNYNNMSSKYFKDIKINGVFLNVDNFVLLDKIEPTNYKNNNFISNYIFNVKKFINEIIKKNEEES